MRASATKCKDGRARRASVLLEVVLALALFVAAATVISVGMNASVQSVHRLRLNTHAANLAITTMSELQMQARAIASIGPEPFTPPFESWTFQIVVSPLAESNIEGDPLQSVEVIISHSEEPIVHRVTQFFRASDILASAAKAEEMPPAEGEEL